ncbi:glycosyltransferase [Aliivibrio fischeri]|uniref:glycosyltransferase n=1 Tax=Aliivibrio fischeri TaxID=668 RepID=UPI0012D8573C|nr:glycosyltransferase [Aliivibrio fischeri]MUK92261.1 glycosyltransferase [Aliivibrio fischeri]
MVVVNLFGLKQTNGMYFYALDYINEIKGVEKILVNRVFFSKLKEIDRRNFKCCSFLGFLFELMICIWNRKFIYTPTSHPLPFYSKQLVVVHDIYPFKHGKLSKIKKILFNISAFTSRCNIGYINKSEVLPYLVNNKFLIGKLFFLPNLMPNIDSFNFVPKVKNRNEFVIGVIGSDSYKKNYHLLCEKISESNFYGKIKIVIYGHDNNYTDSIISKYKNIQIKVMKSDYYCLSKFFSSIDVVVSIAEGEGFGRPLASAVALGLKTYVINNKINSEFFSDVYIFDTVEDMILCIQNDIDIDIDSDHIVTPLVKRDEFIQLNLDKFKVATLALNRWIGF